MEKSKLKDLCIDGKGSYGIAASAVPFDESLYTYLRITDINDDGTLNKSDLKSVDETNASDYLLQPNDIVFARTGGSTGRNYFYDGHDGQFVYAGFLIKFSIDPKKINPKFVKYYCLSQKYRDWVQSFNTGSTRGNINAQTFGNMEISFPSREQQDLLVRILSSLDDKIELNNKINDNLEQQAQAIFKSWFVDFEPFGGEMPEDWKMGKLSDVIDIRDGTHDSPKFYDKGYPLVTSKHLDAFQINYSDVKYISEEDYQKINERSKVDTGDILYSMIGTVGNITLVSDNPVEYAIKNVGLFKTSQNPIYKYFVLNYLKSKDIQDYVDQHLAGSTQKYISLSELRGIPLNIPDTDNLIIYNSIVEPIINTIINNVNENKKLSNLRDTLLPKLMNGEIRI